MTEPKRRPHGRRGTSGNQSRGNNGKRENPKQAQLPRSKGKTGKQPRRCPYSDRCGGCSAIEVDYSRQLARKQHEMEQLYALMALEVPVEPILGMACPYHYRDKVISPYAPGRKSKDEAQGHGQRGGKSTADQQGNRKRTGKEGSASGGRREILTGMYEKGTHRLIPAEKCLVENETAKQVTLAIRDIMARWDMTPYNEDTGTGFVRHAVVRVGHESGEVLVTVVTNEEAFPASKAFCRELKRRVPAVTTVVQNINSRQTNVILGERERVLYGPGFILDTLCGLSFRISSQSFYQVNSTQTEVLYNTAMALAQLGPRTWAIDAYCGTGTIALVAANRGAAQVVGVDSVESAIADARQNARHNGIENAQFIAADATAFMEELAETVTGDGDNTITPAEHAVAQGDGGIMTLSPSPVTADELVIFMDPPRAGSTPQFIRAACSLHPARVVYISCNPKTQVRDLEQFASQGYRATRIQPVDMFPHTHHTECIARLDAR